MLNLRTMLQWALVGAAAAIAPAAMADSITFTLDEPAYQTAAGGETLDFYALVSAPDTNTGTEYLNGDPTLLDPPLMLDDAGFGNNFFPVAFTPGTSVDALLFTITVPDGTTLGLYGGQFEIVGGEDGGLGIDYDTLGTVSFEVNVTPEPSSWQLLALALLSLLGVMGWNSHLRQTAV